MDAESTPKESKPRRGNRVDVDIREASPDGEALSGAPTSSTRFVDRLGAAVLHSKRTRREIEIEAGLTKGYLSLLLAGKRGSGTGVGPTRLRRIAIATRVTFSWLATGEGHMLDDPASATPSVEPASTAFPNCERTLEFLQLARELSPEVADRIRAAAVALGIDLPVEHWNWFARSVQWHVAHAPPRDSAVVPAPRGETRKLPAGDELDRTHQLQPSRFPTLETPGITREHFKRSK